MQLIRAATSFIVVFILAFFLGGWFLMPYLPPVPDQPVTVFQLEYWVTNWAGCLLGLLLGSASAYSIMRGKQNGKSE